MPDEEFDHEHFHEPGPAHETCDWSRPSGHAGLVEEIAELLFYLSDGGGGASLAASRNGACGHYFAFDLDDGLITGYLPTAPLVWASPEERVTREAQLTSWGWEVPDEAGALMADDLNRDIYEGERCGYPNPPGRVGAPDEWVPYLRHTWDGDDLTKPADAVLRAVELITGRPTAGSRWYYAAWEWAPEYVDEGETVWLHLRATLTRSSRVDKEALLRMLNLPHDVGRWFVPLAAIQMRRTADGYGMGVRRGWWPLVAEADQRLSAIDPAYRIVECKQKFAELRIYFEPSPFATTSDHQQMRAITAELRRRSLRICEWCGAARSQAEVDGRSRLQRCRQCQDAASRPTRGGEDRA